MKSPAAIRSATRIPLALAVASALLCGLSAKPAHAYPQPASARETDRYAASHAAAAAASEADPGPTPATPAMEDKFRKLQKEMEKGDAPRAEKAAKPNAAPAEDHIAAGTLALQIICGLAFVLILAVVSIRLLKRMQGRLLSKPGKGGDILEVLETCHLGAHQRIVALRMNDEVGIVGVTQQGISMLTVLKEPADDLLKARAGESNSAAFSDNLNKLLDRFKKPKKVSDLLDEAQ